MDAIGWGLDAAISCSSGLGHTQHDATDTGRSSLRVGWCECPLPSVQGVRASLQRQLRDVLCPASVKIHILIDWHLFRSSQEPRNFSNVGRRVVREASGRPLENVESAICGKGWVPCLLSSDYSICS